MFSIISALVENKPGVLFRLTNMIRARNFNIDSLSVGPTEHSDLSRITITMDQDEHMINQLVKQMGKLIDIVEITRLDINNTVYRELALIKVKIKGREERTEIINLTNIFRGKIIDISKNSIMIEITGTKDKIDAFIGLIKEYNIVEMARTGITALARGVKSE
ncbi:MAG: acetolactate synthase small subunit [Candidatus Nitrosocaldaceae archaeon]